ncbi:MAG TPA: VOC family protein [Acidimicrobiales bacterium]
MGDHRSRDAGPGTGSGAGPASASWRLGALVGRWRTDGHVVGDEPVPVTGTDTYEWLPGRHFLVHHVDVMVGDEHVQAIEIIGEHDPATDSFAARAYDNTGAVTTMRASVDAGGVWTFVGGADVAAAARTGAAVPAAGAVRSTLTVADDGRSMTALWERADDGATWEPWMDMRFTRAPAPTAGTEPARVLQLRLVVETEDFDAAVAFYREAVGMGEQAAFEGEGEARVVILEAGRATLELANPAQSAMIDQVEVGRRASPRLRLALEVGDTRAATARMAAAGAEVLGQPVETPWRSLNARLATPGDLQVTLFEELELREGAGGGHAPAPPTTAIDPGPTRRHRS